MKKIIFILLTILQNSIFAQTELHCGTDEVMKKLYESHPEIKLRMQQQDSLNNITLHHFRNNATYTIPIVFHILHLNGPENISDDQVIDALKILNKDYSLQNPDTSEIIPSFKQIADSTGIQFVLATKDPAGNCTNGIVHYYDTDADWNDMSFTIYSHTWDPTRYLNVYIVRSITLSSGFGAAGYSSFPGSYPDGDPHDAIVVLNNYFGSIGTGCNFLSRILTHEIGHWFNLYHVFGNTNSAGVNCFGSDIVSDTPPTAGYLICPDATDSLTYQLCHPGVDENFQNYMDYSYCCRMFTQGQVWRMQFSLQATISGRNNLWSNANLISTGVINPSSACIPVADFSFNRSVTCVGIPVTFKDASWNADPTIYNWTFPSGSPSSSIDSMPVITYNTPGVYNVTYSSGNSTGTSLPITKTNIISVVIDTSTYQNVWSEGFENSNIPNNDWTVSNSSGSVNWQQSSDAAYSGLYSAKIPLTGNLRKVVTTMTSPSINLSTIPDPMLSFQLATAESNPDHVNNLSVYSSVDCEQTWTEIYSKSGTNLITSGTNLSPFIPGPNEWRKENISLSAFVSAISSKFKFVYSRDSIISGNNVFIDDINISGTTGIKNAKSNSFFNVFPNPSHENSIISFSISDKTRVKILIQDVMGRIVDEILNAELSAGNYKYLTGLNKVLEPAVYIITIRLGQQFFSEKLIIE